MDYLHLPIPPEYIAHTAAEPRDSSRLLVWQNEQGLEMPFHQLPSQLKAGDVLVLNESQVIPARIFATRAARQGRGVIPQPVKVEFLLHRALNPQLTAWQVYARPAKRLKDGDIVTLEGGLTATIKVERAKAELSAASASLQLVFNLHADAEKTQENSQIAAYLHQFGHTPLPPYIHTQDSEKIRERYQTIYANPAQAGSVAAPTAGLHFTQQVFDNLNKIGVKILRVTLHVGAGTFQNPTQEQMLSGKLHAEYAYLSPENAKIIKQTKQLGGNVIAVGTTALRTLETWGQKGMPEQGFSGDTTIFIQPGYSFQVVDKLITNFHLAGSSLRMLVAAFIGEKSMLKLYNHALENNFRFYSFGDTSLLTKA